MASPFPSTSGGQPHLPTHQPSYPGSQGLLMGSNPVIPPIGVSESQGGMDTVTGIINSINDSQSQSQKDFNMALLCRIGQESVQEIVSKTTELFQTLKTLQPSSGTGAAGQEERKAKLQESLKNINLSFKKLRRIYEKCNENCAGMEYTHIESLVPLKDELDARSEDKKTADSVKCASEEHKELVEQVMLRNRQLKEIIDSLRVFIWDINTMLFARKP